MIVPIRTFFKTVGPYVAAFAVLVLAVLLVVAIYLTRTNLPWLAFLTGILSAAVLSLVSRASKAEWIIARREAKISSLQEKLAHEIRLRREIEKKLASSLEHQTILMAAPAAPAAVASDAAQDMFVQSLSEQVMGPVDSVNRILSAIEQNEFCLYCQRIAPLAQDDNHVDHYEILIRLLEEEEGMMPPGAFFPLVEKYGLMPQLDRWVVQHVIEWVATRSVPGLARDNPVFFINLTAASLCDEGFPQFVHEQLQQHKVSGSVLCFEITETEVFQMRNAVSSFATKVRQDDCKIAFGNFGRSGVLFEPLRTIRADFLKIDGSIILDLLRDSSDLAQVIAIAKAAKSINVKTVAELVESDACMMKLREIGIDYAQGFGVSTPLPLDNIIVSSQ